MPLITTYHTPYCTSTHTFRKTYIPVSAGINAIIFDVKLTYQVKDSYCYKLRYNTRMTTDVVAVCASAMSGPLKRTERGK